jgi:hypothetical protein
MKDQNEPAKQEANEDSEMTEDKPEGEKPN